MGINLKQITPHKVSTDLSGYMTYIYGPGGAGKSTLASHMPSPLLLAFEKGYNALPNVMAQDITSWKEMKDVVRQLRDPEVKAMFKTVAIDTVDIASQLCEKYVCAQLGIENIGDGGWTTNGWSKAKKEWESTFRAISMEGYAVMFISHCKDKKFTRKDGTEYNQVVPSCSSAYNEIIKNMVDLEGYIDINEGERRLILRSDDDSVECKSRFAMIEPNIPFSYESLVDALQKAIANEAKLTDNKFITNEKIKEVAPITYDYNQLMADFQTVVGSLMEKDSTKYKSKIVEITTRVLGKGKKFTECTEDQVELMAEIVDELKEL